MTGPPPRAPDGADAPPPPLELTGERTLPGIADERYWFERHVVAYELAAARVRAAGPQGARVVLDAGCGEGYGLAMLADRAEPHARIVGIDLETDVAAHARATYGHPGGDGRPRVEVHTAELMALPLDDDVVDLTVSFQVIEHLHDIPGYLRSLRRVTRPGGEIWIATPNRLTFTPDHDTPVNPFHTREFTAAELTAELTGAGLTVTSMLGIHHGTRLRALERITRRTVPDLLTSRAPERWPAWLRATVHRVDATWFEVRPRDPDGDADLDASLDLLALCRVPPDAPDTGP